MATLVFDIETSALPLEQFDEVQQEYLFRECERIPEPAAREARRAEILQQLNLWPFTAQVVCIAMLNADTSRGQVLFTAEDYEDPAMRRGRSSSCRAWTNSSCSRPSGTWRGIMTMSSRSMAGASMSRSSTSAPPC
jgi:hypothetical protein